MINPEIWKLHSEACEGGETFYLDPDSGFHVFTEVGLNERVKCCGSGCRHCPFAHENVPESKRARNINQASWLTPSGDFAKPVDALFWSGGKDSFLTLLALQRDAAKDHQFVLVTTFDAAERQVAHQELGIADIIRQAQYLKLPLLGIPLHPGRDYADAVEPALRLIQNPARFVFGDLHLEHIRSWREEAFAAIAKELGATLKFPLWHADYEFLMQDLEKSGVVCEVSAITSAAEGQVKLGDIFNRELFESLSGSIGRFGENGEFHTLAKVWDVSG